MDLDVGRLRIVTYPADVLRRPADPVGSVDDRIRALARRRFRDASASGPGRRCGGHGADRTSPEAARPIPMPKHFFRRYLPSPREVRHNRQLRLALGELLHDPNLWHLNRRSVSGAFAVGLFLAWIPLPIQMVSAGLLALLLRVNLPLAVVLVWITNPLTMGPMFWSAWWLGAWILGDQRIPHAFGGALALVAAFGVAALACGGEAEARGRGGQGIPGAPAQRRSESGGRGEARGFACAAACARGT